MNTYMFNVMKKNEGMGVKNLKGEYIGTYSNLYNFLKKRKAKSVIVSDEFTIRDEVARSIVTEGRMGVQSYIVAYKNFWGITKMMEITMCRDTLIRLFKNVPEILYYKILK